MIPTTRIWLPVLVSAGHLAIPGAAASQDAGGSAAEPARVVPYAMSWEEPIAVRAEGYDYDHEVLVALPPSYHVSPERSYPVLWSMDGAMAFSMTAGIVNLYTLGARIPEIIVVGVGHPSEEGMAGLGKRTFDLFPPGSVQRLVSRTTLLAENLRLRGYPGLDLRTRLYTDRDHITVMPLIIADGLQHVYADLIADLPQLPW